MSDQISQDNLLPALLLTTSLKKKAWVSPDVEILSKRKIASGDFPGGPEGQVTSGFDYHYSS